MPSFVVNKATRRDPYKNFKFRLKFEDGADYIAGLSKMTPLKRTTEVVKHREGGDPNNPHKAPGRTDYDAITLSRGVTHDTDFENWANLAFLHGAAFGAEIALKSFRKNLILDVFNESGQKAISYNIFRCWVSEYQALPELDANANAVAIETIKIECEGWERDTNVTEPTEK
ncbi:phage tail protein [uncultured Paludibaculum sp.]|uniref:phage tail protein n=1 Tax=uncultured Paludibaculum sp. TaxID=1765020 RepID=UPI002AAB9D41|nr:phage tail protein [uncultured Paludibaculum sp.]